MQMTGRHFVTTQMFVHRFKSVDGHFISNADDRHTISTLENGEHHSTSTGFAANTLSKALRVAPKASSIARVCSWIENAFHAKSSNPARD